MKIGFNTISIGRYGGKEYAIFIIKYLSELYPENDYFVFLDIENRLEFEDIITNKSVHFVNIRKQKKYITRIVCEFFLLPIEVAKNRIDILYTMNIYGPVISGANKHILKVGNIAPFHRRAIACTYSAKQKVRLYTLHALAWLYFCLVDGIIVMSKTSIGYIPAFFHRKTAGILHSSDIDKMTFCASSYAPSEPLPMKGNNYLLCVTHIDSYKRLETLIDGFLHYIAHYRDDQVVLRIMGDVRDTTYYKTILNQQSKAPFGKRIIFEGVKKKEEIISAMKGCHFLVFHSLVENCPRTFIEALKLGVPILSCNNSVMPEIGQDAITYYNIDKPQDISKKIYELMNDSNKLRRMREASIKRGKEFSWEKTAQETMLFFRKVLQ